MADEEKKIIVDDDWKAEAQAEKERLAQQEAAGPEVLPDPNFPELINLISIQAMVGLGLLGGPGGERIPPNMEVAKHFIDLLQVLDDKTKNNLTAEEQGLLNQVVYDLRMRYVQMSSGGMPPAPGAPGVSTQS
ncbi:MAG: DUF1844 domain-containing protein [Planctomycetota bacterium]